MTITITYNNGARPALIHNVETVVDAGPYQVKVHFMCHDNHVTHEDVRHVLVVPDADDES